MILRDKDANTAWSAASDGTLEERVYYCQNWRGNVSVVIEDDADMVEWVKYSAYGVPFGLPLGDVDSNGDLDTADAVAIATWGGNPYDVRADLNLDGVIDSTDTTLVVNAAPITLGWGNLSDRGNRKGYAGYELDPVLSYTTWHVRLRVLISDLGRFATRDPFEYAGGMNLYEYVASDPLHWTDPFGLLPPPGGDGATPGGGLRPPPDSIYPPGYGLGLVLVPCAIRRPTPDPIAPPGSGLGFLLGGGGLGSLQGLGAPAGNDSLFTGSGSQAAAIPTCGSLLAQFGITKKRRCSFAGCVRRCLGKVPAWRQALWHLCYYTPFAKVPRRGIPGPGSGMQLINRWPWYVRNILPTRPGEIIKRLGRLVSIPLPITLGGCGALLVEVANCAAKCAKDPCRTRF